MTTKRINNRIVAFLGTLESLAVGAITDLLLLHVHLLGGWGISRSAVASMLANVLTFGTASLITWLGHQKWLSGWQAWEQKVLDLLSHASGLPEPIASALAMSVGVTTFPVKPPPPPPPAAPPAAG